MKMRSRRVYVEMEIGEGWVDGEELGTKVDLFFFESATAMMTMTISGD